MSPCGPSLRALNVPILPLLRAIAATSAFAREGGLMYYGTRVTLDQFRQAAGYVDRILRGAKPGDLPVQRADKYTFILNLKTAKAIRANRAVTAARTSRRGHRITGQPYVLCCSA